jgi:hypothetical protein
MENQFSTPKLGHFFSNNAEREALIMLCKNRQEVAAFLLPGPGYSRDRSRLEDALEYLHELIDFEGGAT